MDFRDLTYVLSIAEHGTITKAADALYITQPSLSRFLIDLEEDLEVTLFERINKRLMLTYAGRQYVETANQIFALKAQLDNQLSEVAQSKTGCLRIATTQTHGKYILPRIMSIFKKKYPKFQIVLHEGGVNIMEEYLRSGIVDFSFYSAPPDSRNPDFTYHYVNIEEIVLAVSSECHCINDAVYREGFRHPWLDLRKLGGMTYLMMPPNWRVGDVGNRLLKEAQIKPERIVFATLETALSAAAYGVGGCFVADICQNYYDALRKPEYFSVGTLPQTVDFFVAQRSGMALSYAQQDFIEMIRSIFGEHPYEYQ